ncbi:MAG: hypothetical protein K0S38_259 [Candidatus Paceibacter sp.]|jgi:hypothetical protein|nr:hypothetical protein [Candidatus Paceibacter sp.]
MKNILLCLSIMSGMVIGCLLFQTNSPCITSSKFSDGILIFLSPFFAIVICMVIMILLKNHRDDNDHWRRDPPSPSDPRPPGRFLFLAILISS